MKEKRGARLDAKDIPGLHDADLTVMFPYFQGFAAAAPGKIAGCDLGDEVEGLPVRNRPEKLDVLRVGPHERPCGTGGSAEEHEHEKVSIV